MELKENWSMMENNVCIYKQWKEITLFHYFANFHYRDETGMYNETPSVLEGVIFVYLFYRENDTYVMVIVKYTFVVYFPKGTRLF